MFTMRNRRDLVGGREHEGCARAVDCRAQWQNMVDENVLTRHPVEQDRAEVPLLVADQLTGCVLVRWRGPKLASTAPEE